VRTFVTTNGRHSPLTEYFGQHKTPTFPAAIEIPIHAWADLTLREITARVQAAYDPARRKGAKVSIALVYPDKSGRYVMKNVGVCNTSAGKQNPEVDDKTLGYDLRAQAGDYLDVCVIQPLGGL
jgi:Sin3 associated polypeptide p18 (SAP18)